MFCWNCGKEVEDSHLFCVNCGARVRTIGKPPVQRIMPMQQIPPTYQAQAMMQRQAFSVKLLPMILIVILTFGLFISSFFFGRGNMTAAMLLASVPGFVLLFLIYRMDRIEPEPLPLLIKLFLCGGILVPFWVMIAEELLGMMVTAWFGRYPVIYSVVEAFLVAETTEELGKYAALRLGSWKHPAFNFRFDGVVYATTVALGFEIVENILYIASYGFGTALGRAAFPGHCVFAIYMGYYYGQAKSCEVAGDLKGAAKFRRKAVIIPLIIHGCYDTLCFWSELSESTLLVFGFLFLLVVTMSVLNVTAYRNIKKYAYEDSHI